MRKSLFFTLVLSLCVADFSAFAAVRNARGTNNTTQQGVSTSRSAVRSVRSAVPAASNAPTVTLTKRAATNTTTAKQSPAVVTRAATKKALSMGTKVAEATENTVVSQECQNAYYGCMDAFCMLDNATGGRCQCSDRNVELDAVLDEIMRIDEQSVRIASEGVEQIQMGEYADQINSKAKSVENGIAASTVSVKKNTSGSSSKTLDLTSLMNNNFFDVEDDSTFDDVQDSLVEDISNKTGDELQKAAARVCVAQAPAECKSSLAVLQMAYVQKVKSDCIGYENALKQQRTTSQQKLLAAQKTVREAALDEVRKQNRYETAGECAVAFAQCMQTTAECGSDYTGCVTLAAAENVKNGKTKGSIAKQTTIKGLVSGADITLAATTMEQLLAKKEICASVTKQCVNANKNDAVWTVFLRNVAPTLKAAELIAEQNLRSNCLPTAAECFRSACRAQFGTDDESYDICLSNPEAYKSLCKVQLEPCLEATGGSYENPELSSLWNGLRALLESMKVDACTKEIKDCLLSEDRCGKDFAGCIGMDTYSIARICPAAKLTACMTAKDPDNEGSPYYKDEEAVYDYVAKVAQGLALNIDNSFATLCQDAAKAALVSACGDGGYDEEEDSMCPNLNLSLNSLKSKMHVSYYDATQSDGQFYDSIDEFVATKNLKSSGMKKLLSLKPMIVNQMDIYGIKYTGNTERSTDYFTYEKSGDSITAGNGYTAATDELLSEMNSKYSLLLAQIKSDPKVTYCMTGREVQGFKAGEKFGKTEGLGGRFPKLLETTEKQLATQVINTLSTRYNDEYNEVSEKLNSEYEDLVKRVVEYVNEAEIDAANEKACKANDGVGVGCIDGFWWGTCGPKYRHVFTATYDKTANKCIVSRTTYYCRDWSYGNHPNATKSQVVADCNVEKEHEAKIIEYPSSTSTQ